MPRLRQILMTLLLFSLPAVGFAAISFETIEEKTPGEQYRQLSLLMLITGGTDPAMLEMLQPVIDMQEAGAAPAMDLELDDYVTPLIRIVDQEILLGGAAQVFRFAHENGPEIQRRLTRIATQNPILISMVDINELAADAIIIRNSIADTIEYTESIDAREAAARLAAFRSQTVYLRNMMEYNKFQEELSQITNQAILDLGGRLDAYQRMFDEDVDEDLIRRRIESAQIMNSQAEERFKGEAMLRNAELLMMLILMESQVY
ncbi:MAG: hypothetical protein V2I48_16125 [Xanthomonadales bacterium]|jgi:hypothetical protein|nr:hypothetical protein [Xanthomonadales bacterium]